MSHTRTHITTLSSKARVGIWLSGDWHIGAATCVRCDKAGHGGPRRDIWDLFDQRGGRYRSLRDTRLVCRGNEQSLPGGDGSLGPVCDTAIVTQWQQRPSVILRGFPISLYVLVRT